MADDPPERLSVRRRALFSLAILLCGLSAAELTLWYAIGRKDMGPRPSEGGILLRFTPGAAAELVTPEFRVRYEANALGHRDAERRVEAGAARRVIALGDSFTEGWGVERAEAWPAVAEAAWGGEVWNTGKRGGNPLWFVLQAREARERYSPDALVVQVFDNDLEDMRIYKSRFRFDEAGQVVELLDPEAPPGALARWVDDRQLARGWRGLRRWMKGRARKHPEPFFRLGGGPRAAPVIGPTPAGPVAWTGDGLTFNGVYEDPAGWEDALALEAAALRQLIAEAQGLPVALLYIPSLESILNAPERNPHLENLRAVSEATGAPLWDGGAILRAGGEAAACYYPSDRHLRPAGQRRIGEAVAERLRSWLGAPER